MLHFGSSCWPWGPILGHRVPILPVSWAHPGLDAWLAPRWLPDSLSPGWLLALLLVGAPLGASLDNGLALTPIMGWNPWYTYGNFPGGTESNVLLAANALKEKGLAEAGYDIVGLDCGYSTKHRDAAGNLVVNTTRFPRGIKWLAEQIHALGLRFGMYAGQGYAQCCSGSEDKNATDGSGPGCSKDKQHPTCRSASCTPCRAG